MPTLSEAVASLDAQSFIGRQRELDHFRAWLSSERLNVEILSVSGPGGIGKTSLLAVFARIAEEEGAFVFRLDARDFRPTKEGFLQALGAADLDEVYARLTGAGSVLLIDTFEELGELIPFLTDEFLPGLDAGCRVVVAGRQGPRQLSTHLHGWARLIRPLQLGCFSCVETEAYLDQRGITAARLREQLPRATGGHPLALSMACDLVVQSGIRDLGGAPAWHLVLRSLLEMLLRDVPDPLLRELLEAAAVVRQFDETTLEALTGRSGISAAFDQLCQLTIVRPGQHGLLLHDEVRRILADDLRWRRPEHYRELRLRALAHYRTRMQIALPQEREWLLAERLYLWEHAWVQTMLFGQDEASEVWVEPGTNEDEQAALEIEAAWHQRVMPALGIVKYESDPEYSFGAHMADIANLLDLRGRRLAIARDQEGRPLRP